MCCNKNYQKAFDENLKRGFASTNKFANHDINNFFSLLQKDAYPYQYINDGEKLNKTSLAQKEDFYSHLNMENITDADYMHSKKDSKDFKITNLEECYNLYVQSNMFLLAGTFEDSRNTCPEIYELYPACFRTAPELTWVAALKKVRVKTNLLTDINVLLMVAKGIRSGICYAIYRFVLANNKWKVIT